MKNWFKIIKDEKEVSSEEILSEKENLALKMPEKKRLVDSLSERLQSLKIEELAGNQNKELQQSIQIELEQATNEMEAISGAIQILSKKYAKAVEKELLQEIEDIDGEILALESEKQQMEEKFLKLAGEAAGLWAILNGGSGSAYFKAGRLTRPWARPRNEMEAFDEAFEKSNGGRKPIPNIIHGLRKKRRDLVDGLPDNVARSYRLRKSPIH